MKSIKYNANTIVRKSLHRPCIVDGSKTMILYSKVEGYNSSSENGYDAEYSKSPLFNKFLAESQNTYNSPRNIRRVFITGSRVAVQYFAPIISKGKSTGKTWSNNEYRGMSIKEALRREKEFQSMGPEQKERLGRDYESCTINGNIFGAFIYPLMCNNIEEIYIDESVFEVCIKTDGTVPDMERVSGISSETIYTVAKSIIGGQVSGLCNSGKASGIPYALFMQANRSKIQSFNRLKVVGVINGLDRVIGNSTECPCKKCGEILEGTWWENNLELLKVNCPSVLISSLNVPLNEFRNFSLAQNIYKYDKEVLANVVMILSKKIEERERIEKYGAKEPQVSENGKRSDVEEYLKIVEADYGITRVAAVLNIMKNVMTEKQIEDMLSTFSRDGKEKYKVFTN